MKQIVVSSRRVFGERALYSYRYGPLQCEADTVDVQTAETLTPTGHAYLRYFSLFCFQNVF